MKIARIAKKNDKNVIVWLDNDEKLYLSYEVMLKNGLRTDMELSESHFALLIRENQKHFIKQSAYNILARRHHSARELKTKLRQKRYDADLIEGVIEELIDSGLLNDERFAAEYSEEKIRTSSWGKTKLRSELMKKGIENSIIVRVLEENLHEEDQLDHAYKLVEKKYNSLKSRGLEKQKLMNKLYSFLLSKGYNYDLAKQALAKLFTLPDEEDQ